MTVLRWRDRARGHRNGGDKVQVVDEQGGLLGEAFAATSGRVVVTLNRSLAKGTKVLVVVEHIGGRISSTAQVTAA